MVNPFAYEEYRKDKIRQKIEETRAQRVQLKVSIVLTIEFAREKYLIFMLLFQRSPSSISEFFHLLLIFLVYFIYHEGFIMDSVAVVSWEIMPGGLVLSP